MDNERFPCIIFKIPEVLRIERVVESHILHIAQSIYLKKNEWLFTQMDAMDRPATSTFEIPNFGAEQFSKTLFDKFI